MTQPALNETPLGGIDGCRSGWVAAVVGPSITGLSIVTEPDLASLIQRLPDAAYWAIDMPVDLPLGPPADDGQRACDHLARERLGWPRSSSVFSAPPLGVLDTDDYEAACQLSEAASGRKISVQAWNLVPKIREVRALIAAKPDYSTRVFETHPELCFARLNGGKGIEASKKTPDGRAQRLKLLSATLGHETVQRAMRSAKAFKGVANDDKIDAMAALVAAMNASKESLKRLPPRHPGDTGPHAPTIAY